MWENLVWRRTAALWTVRSVEVERKTHQETRLHSRVHAGATMLPDAVVLPRRHTTEINAPLCPHLGDEKKKKSQRDKVFISNSWAVNLTQKYKNISWKDEYITEWVSTVLSIPAPKINKHQHAARLRGLVRRLKAKEISGWNVFLILACFSRDYFQQCTYSFIFPLSKGILMGESTNKYVRFDVFILSFFFFSFFHCSALSVKQLACLLFLTRSFDISHNLTKATWERA